MPSSIFRILRGPLGVFFTIYSLPSVVTNGQFWLKWFSEQSHISGILQAPTFFNWVLLAIGGSMAPSLWWKRLVSNMKPSAMHQPPLRTGMSITDDSDVKLGRGVVRNADLGIEVSRSRFRADDLEITNEDEG